MEGLAIILIIWCRKTGQVKVSERHPWSRKETVLSRRAGQEERWEVRLVLRVLIFRAQLLTSYAGKGQEPGNTP